MTLQEKREKHRAALLSRAGKNKYSQNSSKRLRIESGYGDCSGTTYYWMKKLFGINIGTYTVAQLQSSKGQTIDLDIIDGIPDESKMEIGDHLYFRGADESRPKCVGHVEVYIGNGQIFGHGSGTGGTVKDMAAYCKRRKSQKTSTSYGDKGLICVRRFIFADDEPELVEQLPDENNIVKQYQEWLNNYCDAGLEIDGKCGPKTKKASVKAIQTYLNKTYKYSLAVDGSFGPKTRVAYKAAKKGQKGDHVRIIQGLLYGHDYDPNGFDGSFGSGCRQAVKNFQKARELEVDGSCGRITFAELVK